MSRGDEFELIDRIRRQAASDPVVPIGIGDDTAVVAVSGTDPQVLVTTDVLMEGVHFDLSLASAKDVGRKSLAVNLSDIAAMAGRPTAAFVGLVLPRSRGANFADEVMAGLLELAAEYDVTIAGGDTNIWDGPAVIGVTLLGEPTGDGPVTRSGARAGDWLMVTGALGGSLSSGRHLNFIPRVREAERLNTTVDLHAMIDLSDGLASDIQHLTRESGVGAIVDADAVPVHEDVDAQQSSAERVQHALSDGEDFELLFTVGPNAGERLLRQPLFETPLTKIGLCTREPGCWQQTKVDPPVLLKPTGWQHRFQT